MARDGSTLVEHSTHYPKIEGLNPATATERKEIKKNNFFFHFLNVCHVWFRQEETIIS